MQNEGQNPRRPGLCGRPAGRPQAPGPIDAGPPRGYKRPGPGFPGGPQGGFQVMSSKYRLALVLATVVLALDQGSKALIRHYLPLWTKKEIIPGFFDLVHTLNRGAAFGFLNRSDIAWQTYFFIAANALAVVIIFHLLRTVQSGTFMRFGLGLLLGGALGNLVDRIRIGEVTDFLDFYISSHHWPAFNVADMAISAGSCILLISLYRQRGQGSL
jgi:signal peptidase II